MSAHLYTLGRWCYQNRIKVLGIWFGLLTLLGVLAYAFQGSFDDDFEIPGSASQEALNDLRMTFPQAAALNASAIFVAPEGTNVAQLRDQIEKELKQFEELDTVETTVSPWFEYVSGMVAKDGSAALATIQLNVTETPTPEQLAELLEVAESVQKKLPAGTTVALGGQAFNIELPELSITEGIGLLVALAVLFVVLGSLVTAGLPLITAVVGVGIAMAIMMLIARIATVNSTTPILSVMLGLAVGIDYALFILSRHRDQLSEGMDPEESCARAVGTAGSAVIFAGLTVFIALLGLGVAGIPFLTSMGAFAAITVALAVAIAITMLPAFIGLLGDRMRPKVVAKKAAPNRGRAIFTWWASVITRHPVITSVAVVAGIVALWLPAGSLQLSLPHSGQHSPNAPDRIAYDLITEHFGEGYNAPLVVTADIVSSTDPLGLLRAMKSDVENTDGVAVVALAVPNENADTGMIQVLPTTGADAPETAELATALRDLGDDWQDRYGIDTAVTGYTAIQIDVTQRLAGALLPFGILVVGLSMVLLAAVFRSIAIPIKATLGFLLSTGAAFGATALVFTHGWINTLVNLERPMPVISFLPIILMGILFGLAMDYEVFLVSRMREEYVHGKPTLQAIRDGFVASGPVVVAAALIMFSVFAFFVPAGMGPIKSIAFSLAVGVAVDAFAVRMTLTPAVLALLGERSWWLPGWLDRLLPSFDVEGETLTKQLALANWPGNDSLVHAEGIEVSDVFTDSDLTVWPGQVVGIAGPVGSRTGLALALSGRLALTRGRARVAGELLPEAAAQVRRRTYYLDLARVPDVAQALEQLRPKQGRVAFVDNTDVIGRPTERAAMHALIERAHEGDFALFLCAAGAEHLDELRPDAIHTLAQPTLEGSLA